MEPVVGGSSLLPLDSVGTLNWWLLLSSIIGRLVVVLLIVVSEITIYVPVIIGIDQRHMTINCLHTIKFMLDVYKNPCMLRAIP